MEMPKRIKGKEWYSLVAPRLFKNKVIGEALVSDPKEILGRTVAKTLPELGGNPSKYYVKIKFKAYEVEDKRIKMKYIGQECLRDFIVQMVRKGSSRIDSVIKTKTKDDKHVVIKVIGISIKRTKSSVRTKLRREIEDMIKKKVEKMKIDDLVDSVIRDRLQVQVRKNLNKTYPLRKFEVRKIEVLDKVHQKA